jgi:carbonic anhydrase
MKSYEKLLLANKAWSQSVNEDDPYFFKNLANVQTPEFLWIGCSDSRVPPDRITGTMPGEIFIHRNIANLVVHTDINMLSVLEYSVNVLKVKHVIVCGHYGCGGVKAAMGNANIGIINKWLRNIKDVYKIHREEVNNITDDEDRLDRMIELNIKQQLINLSETSIIQKAWKDRQGPDLHGWVYDLEDGLIHPISEIPAGSEIDPIFKFNNL